MREMIIKLIGGISEQSYYRWKKETHPLLINLLEKYFDEKDLEEFIQTGKIEKFEKTNIKETEMEIFFADNGFFKILNKFDKEMSLSELIEIENLKLNVIPDEVEDYNALKWILNIFSESKNYNNFLEKIEKYNFLHLKNILNILEINAIIKNFEYIEKKINIEKELNIDEMEIDFGEIELD